MRGYPTRCGGSMRHPPLFFLSRSGSVRIRHPPLPMPSVPSLLLLDFLRCQRTAGYTEAQVVDAVRRDVAAVVRQPAEVRVSSSSRRREPRGRSPFRGQPDRCRLKVFRRTNPNTTPTRCRACRISLRGWASSSQPYCCCRNGALMWDRTRGGT